MKKVILLIVLFTFSISFSQEKDDEIRKSCVSQAAFIYAIEKDNIGSDCELTPDDFGNRSRLRCHVRQFISISGGAIDDFLSGSAAGMYIVECSNGLSYSISYHYGQWGSVFLYPC